MSSSPLKSGFLVFVVILFIIIISTTTIKCSGVPSGYYVQVDEDMKNITKEIGESIKLHCEITGNPVPEYLWFKDHKALNQINSRRHSIESIPWGSRLSIENLNSDDTGWYSCVASNHHDNQSTSSHLSVVPIGNLTGGRRSGGKGKKKKTFNEDDFEDGGYDYDEDDDKMEYEIVYVENGEVDRYDNMASKSQKKHKPKLKNKPEQTGRHPAAPCSIYTGKVCRAAFNNQTVRLSVVNNVGSQSTMDKKLGALQDAMLATSNDDLCTRIAVTFLCRVSYRACDSGSGLGAYIPAGGYFDQQDMAPLCKEDCRIFEGERCSSEREIIRVSTLVGDYQNFLIRDSMCSASISMDQPTPPCVWGTHVSSRDESVHSGGFPHMPYVVAALVAISLVVCLGLIVYGRRRQQNKNKKKKQQHEMEINKRKALLSSKEQPVISPAPVPTFSVPSPVRSVSGVNVTFLYPVGNGHFGPVYAAQLLDHQSPNVVRQQHTQHVIAATLSDHADLTSKSRFDCEMRALSSLNPDHPNVLKCVAVCPVGSPRSILFEFVDGVDLKQNLLHLSSSGTGGLDLMTALEYCCQVSRGFEYLAERNYYHGDLSARNVLVPRAVDRNLRITNLGVSRQIYESDYCVGPCGQILPLRWCPTERVMMAEASPATEIWSFGVLLWEILSGGLRPYITLSDAQLLEEMNQGKHPIPQLPSTCPEDVGRIVEECWHPEPPKRVTASVLRRNVEGASFRVFNNNVCLSNFNTLGNRVVNDPLLQHSYPYNPQNQLLSRPQQLSSGKTQHASPATSSNQTSSTSAINSPSRLNHAMSLGERVDDGSDVNIKQYTC